MKNQIESIRCLASRDLQDRYIVHGTKDEYLLPDELVGDALTFVEDVVSGRRGRQLTNIQRAAVAEFGRTLHANEASAYAAIPNAELIASNPQWAAIRDAAQQLIEVLEVL